jgi:hypothetical protein
MPTKQRPNQNNQLVKRYLVQRNGQTLAIIQFGQPARVKQDAEGRTLLRQLAMRRIVYDPQSHTMAVFPEDECFKSSLYWWRLAMGEATFPRYTLVPAKENI